MTSAPETTDFVVLHPGGHLSRHTRDSGSLRAALAREIPNLGTQGMGRLRAWFDDDFGTDATAAPNALADTVLRGIGYMQPPGFWRGPVALSAEEDHHGDIGPLPAAALAVIEDLAGAHS